MLQCEPRSGHKSWFLARTILPSEEFVDTVVRELFEETGLILTVDDLTLLSGDAVRVSLPNGKLQHVYVLMCMCSKCSSRVRM
jgi:8-oxo-dGTP pyrophosphatase MutT (NUDIX family)